MRFPTLPLVLLLPAVAVAQTRQFQADANRPPNLYLPGGTMALACGDVDGDGDLDCLVAQRAPYPNLNLVNVVLFRRQSGAWQQTVLGSVSATSVFLRIGITLADLDGDAALDAVIAVAGDLATPSSRIVCFRNVAGSLSLATTTQFPGTGDAEFVVGDVDGDLDRDLIVGLRDVSGLPLSTTLVLHDGAFGFQVVANALPPTPAAAPELADIDADGDLDVLAVDATGRVLSFINQNGTYAAGGVLAAGVARHVVAADFDGDGDADVMLQEPAGGTVLLRNTPSGFLPRPVAPGGETAGARPVLADFDGDQDIDVAAQVDSGLRVLRNDGLANFDDEPVAGAPAAFAAGDVDQDGVLDLVFDANHSGLAVALGRPDRMLFDQALARAPFTALSGEGYTEGTGDFDGDGRADIVQQDYRRLLVRRSRGAGEWSTVVLPVAFLRPRARAMDVDGDGDDDIVAVNSDTPGGLQVFRNDGGFAFTALAPQTLPSAWIVGTGDFDGDRRVDVLVGTGTTIQLLQSLGGTFAPPTSVVSGANSWLAPGIWDYDGDRDLDLLVAERNANCIQLLTNDGNGSFTVTNPCVVPAPPNWGSFFDYALVDIDSDGDPDVFTWGYGSGRLMINNGGSFTTVTISGVFASALLMPWFADWDDDGDIDLLQLGGPAQLFLNSGNGTLVDATSTRLGWLEFSGAAVADVDGDDDPDIIGSFGMLATQPLNQLRSVASLSVPSLGGQLRVRLGHEPGFATGSVPGLPILATRLRSTPLRVPGIAGTLQVDAATAIVLPVLTLPAPAGTAEVVVGIPLLPALVGLDVYAQGLLLAPIPAFTATVHERALP